MSEKKSKVSFLGHATVLIETEGGKRFLIDPFLTGNPRCPAELQDPGPLDYICLTHGHSDHASDAVQLARKYGCTVFATFELANLIVQDGVPEGNIESMNKGGRVEIPQSNGLAVTMTNAFHSSSYPAADGKTYYAGEAGGIVIETESGKSVYHAGDTCLFGDMALIGERFKPDVALLPIGDRFTMGPQDAAKAVELIKPKVAIPIHYATFDALSGRSEEFEELLESGPTQAVVLEPGETFSF